MSASLPSCSTLNHLSHTAKAQFSAQQTKTRVAIGTAVSYDHITLEFEFPKLEIPRFSVAPQARRFPRTFFCCRTPANPLVAHDSGVEPADLKTLRPVLRAHWIPRSVLRGPFRCCGTSGYTCTGGFSTNRLMCTDSLIRDKRRSLCK